MAFDTLQSLGEEKFRTVVQKLLGGTCESSVAKLIQEQWGDCQDILEDALVEELKALHEAASTKTHEHGPGAGDNRFSQLRDSELGCLEGLIDRAIVADNCIFSITKDGVLTDSEARIVITLMKVYMEQIAMIHNMKLDLGLDAYKRGMSVKDIDASNQYEYEEKMRWIKAERFAKKCEEDALRQHRAKYGDTPPSASEVSRIYDDLSQRLDAINSRRSPAMSKRAPE